MTSWRPSLIALDVDGTVLDSNAVITPSVRAGITRAVDAGVHVVLSTGRTVLGIRQVVGELGFATGTALCSNGAVRLDLDTGRITELASFDPRPVVEMLRRLLPGGRFSVEEPGRGNRVSIGYSSWDLIGIRREVDDVELLATPTTRLVGHWPGTTRDELAELLADNGIPGVTLTYDHDHDAWLTVVGDGISKASALELLRVELGVAADATLAIGDGHNDIAMLRWAALGVAMGNASDEVKGAADEVTGSIADDGVADVLDRLFPV